MTPLSEKGIPSTGNTQPMRYYKQAVFLGVLVAVLLWGSTSLITSIAYLRQTTQIESLLPLRHSQFPSAAPADPAHVAEPKYPLSQTIDNKIRLNYSLIRENTFAPSSKQVQWIKEPTSILNDKGTYVLKDENEYLIKSIVDEDYQISLFNDTSFVYGGIAYDIQSLVASPDLSKAVLRTNATHNWRWSTFALYWVLDVKKKTIEPILDDDTESKVATFKWSPTSQQIAYIKDNNVYIKDLPTGSVDQVTYDGGAELFYGKPDWVYEEEVFGDDIVLWWSPQGDKVAFLKTNDTLVPEYSIPYFVQDDKKYEDYPEFRNIKYPKAGYPNPKVELLIYQSKQEGVSTSDITTVGTIGEDLLITEVAWVSDDFLLVKTSNRKSDLLEVHLVDAITSKSKLIRTHYAEDSWFEISSNTVFVPKNESQGFVDDGYIDTIVVDGFNHLGYFSPPDATEPIILTKGQWEVVDGVASYDYIKNEIYFTATKKSAIERHIYSVNLLEAIENSKVVPKLKNVTDDSQVGWYIGTFSSGSRYLLLNYRGPEAPYQKLVDLHKNGITIKVLEDNKELIETLKDYAIPENNYQIVTLGVDESTGEEIKAHAIETLPLNFDESKKYPVLFFVYGGPGSQTVSTRFLVSFSQAVSAQLDAIVVTVDGRGTGYNNLNPKIGSQFKFCVRDQLGYFEPRDQITAAKIWSSKPYVDSSKIAIWGWSYGGFLTLKTLETDSIDHVFSYGMSVAPVTKWKLYDSIYTERYMSTPQENPSGYETASIHDFSNFKNVTRFMVAHGSGDDNVHFQNSLKLIDQFNLNTIENFDFYIFPDSDHSISYHNGNVVVYDRLLAWLGKAFGGEYE